MKLIKGVFYSPSADNASTEAVEGDLASAEAKVKGAQDDSATKAEPTVDWQAKYEELRRKAEEDVGKVKSALQKRETSLSQEKSALEKKLEEVLKSNMDDGDRKEYERERLTEEYDKLRIEADEARKAKEQTETFYKYKDFFVNELGLSVSELDTSDVEHLFNSGMAAVKNKIKSAAKPAEDKAKPAGKPIPETAKPVAGAVPEVSNLSEAAKKYTNGNLEKLFEMADRNPAIRNLLTEIASKSK